MIKVIQTILQIALLIIISFIGNMLHTFLNIPLPGSIIGLILLFILLSLHIIPSSWIDRGAGFLLAILPVLFIPTMAGVVNYPTLFSFKGIALVIIILISTLLTMVVSGKISEYAERKSKKRKEGYEWDKHSSQS